MAQIVTVPISEYRVFDEFEQDVLQSEIDFEQADAALIEWKNKRPHNEIILIAVIDT